jgi:TonB family protein
MRLRIALLAFSALACGAILLFARTAATQKASAPQSFYIVTHVFSDDLPSGYEEILQVTHQEKDVCVRLIRISLANRNCGGQLVRAAERILPNTAVGQATGNVDLCSYTDREVESALKHAAPKGVQVIFDSATQDIVAKCGAKEIVLGLHDPSTVELVNADALHLAHHDLPAYPVLAKQTRQFGEVRLKIFADPQTGVVKDVQKLSGRPILVDIAIEAAKKWQFSPSAQNEQPVEATLKFTLCPGEN